MKETELKEKVDAIVNASRYDPEAHHADEDELHLEVINAFCPDWVKKEIKRLSDTEFPRWCA